MKTLFVLAYISGFVWLGVWELAALLINDNYTISDLTWTWEGPGWTAGRFLVLASLIWLTLHLSFKWLR